LDWVAVIILGLVQGLTEFLPISSSGHLVLTERILKVHSENIYLEVFLHFGTFMAVVIIFRKDIRGIILALWEGITRAKKSKDSTYYLKLFLGLLIGTVPAVVLGLFFKGYVESAFDSFLLTSWMLIITGLFLFITRFSRVKKETVGLLDSLIIGLAQGLALLPGISRTGWTIGSGLLRGITGTKAAEFSFLLSLPAVFGASVLKLKESLDKSLSFDTMALYFCGALIAFIAGYISIKFLLQILKRGKLQYFGYYCIIVGTLSLIFL